ncbi:hypothetical protein [Methanobrevibacter filiformis]|uniref:hypothetical protein n=1 Tax=Methanobrevibacter filiformis TaxID=55758 RepID=UPI000A6FC82C|nr:hypothetical protein [Methanobrevibacter filiformis]
MITVNSTDVNNSITLELEHMLEWIIIIARVPYSIIYNHGLYYMFRDRRKYNTLENRKKIPIK